MGLILQQVIKSDITIAFCMQRKMYLLNYQNWSDTFSYAIVITPLETSVCQS